MDLFILYILQKNIEFQKSKNLIRMTRVLSAQQNYKDLRGSFSSVLLTCRKSHYIIRLLYKVAWMNTQKEVLMGIVIPENMGKDGQFWQFNAEFWMLQKKFINGDENGERTDAYWEEVISATSELAKKYKFRYAKNLIIAFLNELEARDKDEKIVAGQTQGQA